MMLGNLSLQWMHNFKHPGVNFSVSCRVEVDSTAIKREFNSTCKLSSVFQRCGSVSEIVRLQLVKSFCLAMLTHCIGALNLSKQA